MDSGKGSPTFEVLILYLAVDACIYYSFNLPLESKTQIWLLNKNPHLVCKCSVKDYPLDEVLTYDL